MTEKVVIVLPRDIPPRAHVAYKQRLCHGNGIIRYT